MKLGRLPTFLYEDAKASAAIETEAEDNLQGEVYRCFPVVSEPMSASHPQASQSQARFAQRVPFQVEAK